MTSSRRIPYIATVAQGLFEAFEQAGEELYLVGGSVRDYEIHKFKNDPAICQQPVKTGYIPKDLDFATSAYPDKTQRILKGMGLPVYPIGIEFGTVASKLDRFPVEITTYRCKESYTKGSRKPEVIYGKSLDQDLSRRDLTINAMAMDKNGKVYDPYYGVGSYIEGFLLTPTEDPDQTFIDDPLRMLRVFRFQSQLGAELHAVEVESIAKLKAEIHNISAERIFSEMSKLLMTKKPGPTLLAMGKCGLLGEIFPELQKVIDFKQNQGKYHSKLVWPHVLDVVDNSPVNLPVRWAALFHDICKPETYSETSTGVHFYQHEAKGAHVWNRIADRLKVSSAFKKRVNFLIYHHLRLSQLCTVFPKGVSKSALRRLIKDCDEYLDDLFELSLADITSHHPDTVKAKRDKCIALKAKVDEINAECNIVQLKLPTGLGKDIAKALRIPHGPELGRIMRQLTSDLIAGVHTEDSDFIAAAKEIYDKTRNIQAQSKA